MNAQDFEPAGTIAIGNLVWYYHRDTKGPREVPRVGFVLGPGPMPGSVHLAVYGNPSYDRNPSGSVIKAVPIYDQHPGNFKDRHFCVVPATQIAHNQNEYSVVDYRAGNIRRVAPAAPPDTDDNPFDNDLQSLEVGSEAEPEAIAKVEPEPEVVADPDPEPEPEAVAERRRLHSSKQALHHLQTGHPAWERLIGPLLEQEDPYTLKIEDHSDTAMLVLTNPHGEPVVGIVYEPSDDPESRRWCVYAQNSRRSRGLTLLQTASGHRDDVKTMVSLVRDIIRAALEAQDFKDVASAVKAIDLTKCVWTS